MGINLEKGQKIDLTKSNPTLNNLMIGLGWDTNKYEGGLSFDLDSCLVMLTDNKITSEDRLVYFGNLQAQGVLHNGDNLTGAGDGDDEIINIKLSEIPDDVDALDIHVVIYKGESKNQNFGMISNTFVRVIDTEKNEELCRFDMGEDFSTQTRLNVCKIYKHNGDWKFNAVGQAANGEIRDILKDVGMEV